MGAALALSDCIDLTGNGILTDFIDPMQLIL